jgi:formylglycine-generating enzyme required for sulfatase activity
MGPRSLLTQARRPRSQVKIALMLLSWVILSVTVGWAAPGQFDIPLKDRSGKQVGSFSYKESHALVVGIGDYNGGWPLLPGVKRDVEKVTQALENNGFHVVVKQNLDHTELEKTFRDFILQYGLAPENRLLLYFAGHGYTLKNTYDPNDPTQWTGVIVARNAPLPTQEITSDFRAKTLPIDRFASMARDIQSRHALFIFDSCFSGARGFSLFVPSPDDLVQGVTAKTGEYVRQFISSGSADQQVPDVSAFRKHFILALEGEADRNRDGYVAGSELGIFLQEKVMGDTERQQTPQFGKISDSRLNKGEFLFPLTPPTAAACVSTSLPPHIPSPVMNNLGMEFVAVPAAELRMGTDEIPTLRPSHKVTISQPFYIGKYEVTQAQWTTVMGKNPSRFTGDPHLPVENVSWNEVQEFLHQLNARESTSRYRLPTEAEWEHASRSCVTTIYPFGDDESQLERYAWAETNAGGRTHAVGQLRPNGWGLYDMLGNVWEWCQDWYGDYPATAVANPQGATQGIFRVYRGCGWLRGESSLYCQPVTRHGARPNFAHPSLGFRVVMTVSPGNP